MPKPEDLITLYGRFPEPVRAQLERLVPYFKNRRAIKQRKQYLRDKYNCEDESILAPLAVLDQMQTRDLLHAKFFSIIYAFDTRGNVATIDNVLTKGDHVCLFNATLKTTSGTNDKCIIKYYKHGGRDTTYETNIYRELRQRHCPILWFSSGFYLFKNRCLVMEPLLAVTKKDDEFAMMIEVIQQLRFLHRFGVHNDLKPGNIMKRAPDSKLPWNSDVTLTPDGAEFTFFVIDYGGTATKRVGSVNYGRWCWSPRYCIQPLHGRGANGGMQETSFKHDFYELIVTARALQCFRTGEKQVRDKDKKDAYIKDPYRDPNTYKGLLRELYEYTFSIDASKGPQPEHYYGFIKLCMKGTTQKCALLPEYKKALGK